jgi:hypothetical protein
LHATVLLAVKYLAELNKYILLVRVICEKYRFRGQSNVPRRLPVTEATNKLARTFMVDFTDYMRHVYIIWGYFYL